MSEDKDRKKPAPLAPNRIETIQHGNNIWLATVEDGTQFDDVLDPAFWAFHANRMRLYDHICVRTDDGSWYAELLVVAAERTWAQVVAKPGYPLELVAKKIELTATELQQYDLKFKGPVRKWEVIRRSDAATVKGEFRSHDEAATWLREYLRTTGRRAA